MTSREGHAHAVGGVGDGADGVVAVHHALGEAGGSGGIHEQEGVVGADGGLALGQFAGGDLVGAGQHGVPTQRASGAFIADDDDVAQGGEGGGAQRRGVAGINLGGDFAQHIEVIDGAGAVHEDQRGGIGVVDQVLHVLRAEAGV